MMETDRKCCRTTVIGDLAAIPVRSDFIMNGSDRRHGGNLSIDHSSNVINNSGLVKLILKTDQAEALPRDDLNFRLIFMSLLANLLRGFPGNESITINHEGAAKHQVRRLNFAITPGNNRRHRLVQRPSND